MYAPRSMVTFLLASVIAGGVAQTPGPRTLVLVFLIIFLAGTFQALFGILRLGNLISYIPSPVKRPTSCWISSASTSSTAPAPGSSQQLHDRLVREGKRLLVSHAQDNPLLWSVMPDMGVAAALARDALFADTDAALEWAEDQLINGSRSRAALSGEVPAACLSAASISGRISSSKTPTGACS